jgi:DNA-binding transcriptional LysR family regulator
VEQLSQHRLLGVRLSSGQLGLWRMRRPSGRGWVDYQPPARVWTNDPESLIDLALADAGICQTGLCHVLPALKAGTLKVVMAGVHDSGDREIALHYPHRQFLPSRVRVVVDSLLAHFAQAPLLHISPQQLSPAWLAASPGLRRSVPTKRRKPMG